MCPNYEEVEPNRSRQGEGSTDGVSKGFCDREWTRVSTKIIVSYTSDNMSKGPLSITLLDFPPTLPRTFPVNPFEVCS